MSFSQTFVCYAVRCGHFQFVFVYRHGLVDTVGTHGRTALCPLVWYTGNSVSSLPSDDSQRHCNDLCRVFFPRICLDIRLLSERLPSPPFGALLLAPHK